MVHQVLFGFQVLDDLSVNLNVLKSSVKNDENLGGNGPVVEV